MLLNDSGWQGPPPIDERFLGDVHKFIVSKDTRIRGPVILQADPALEPALAAFRERGYARKLPHLLAHGVKKLDEAFFLDKRAFHFMAQTFRPASGDGDDRMVAAARLLPRPFEFELLSPALEQLASQRPCHLEISRLLVDAGASSSRLTAQLLLAMGRWAWGQGHLSGFWALCSGPQTRVFRRFGMKVVREGITLPRRPGRHYALLEAGLGDLATAMRSRLPLLLSPEAH